MKKALKQFGKAICYLILYFGLQIIVTVGAMFVYLVRLGTQMAAEGLPKEAFDVTDPDVVNRMTVAITPWVVIISTVLTLFMLWIFFLVRRKKLLQEVEARSFSLAKMPAVLCASLGVYLLISFGMQLLPLSEEAIEDYLKSAESVAGASFSIHLLIANVIAAPVVEEVIFRGLMFGRMKKAMPVWLAAVLSSLIFGLMHGQILWTCYTFLMGLVCCYVAYKTNSILASVFVHMFFNLFGSILTFLTEWIPVSMYWLATLSGVALLAVAIVLLWPGEQTEAVPEEAQEEPPTEPLA